MQNLPTSMRCSIAMILVVLWIASHVAVPTETAADEVSAARHFDEQIAPLFARRCLECHNDSMKKGGLDLSHMESALTGGESGAALVAGKPDESYLWERISNDEMPPKKPLAAAEKQRIRDWIVAGARWGTSPIDLFRFTTDVRAGYDWWSLQTVRRPEPPTVRDVAWPRHAIDRFVLARLEAQGIAPAPDADRRTFVRRLFFDVIGLPPTPEETAAFILDPDPRAYEKLVDRLLASPRYGERWARHWLDLARFGESNGFEYDEPRADAWLYRDWLIDAFNNDMPYDAFARQQLAGDVLAPDDPQAIKATGFLVAGAYDTVGQKQQSAAMKAVVRQDELEDIIGTTCQTFLGLTANCARCHDHKFDPIRQTEYYQLTAALGGVRHGQRDVTSAAEKADWTRQASANRARIAQLLSDIGAIDAPIRSQILAERRGGGAADAGLPSPVARWEFARSLGDALGELHGEARGAATLDNRGLHLDGREAYVATVPLEKDLRAKTLEVWLLLDDLQQSGGGAMSVQTLDGAVFDAVVFGERDPARWMAGSNNHARTQSFSAPDEVEADQQLVKLAIAYADDGTIGAYRNGRPYGKSYRAPAPVTFKAGEAQVLFGLRHGPPGGNKMLAATIVRAQLFDRALTAEEAAQSAAGSDFVSEADLLARLPADVATRRQVLSEELKKLEASLGARGQRTCYAVAPRQSEPARLLARGDSRQAGPVVRAGGIASLVGLSADFGVAADAPEALGRLAFVRWVTSAQNPLFSRVIVNRLWHYHFGVGLVDTPNDFGFGGGRPTHPELLDWLAAELLSRKWSLKQLHREILLSSTYRQSTTFNAVAAKHDADNRLLWRRSPQRLEAEVVRDATLAIAGELNLAQGGPGFRDCTQVLRSGTYTYEPADPVGPQFNRRSIYRTWIRGGRSGLLDAFDCPDPSTASPRRARTTTPLQALVLLNNAFVLRMADKFAARVRADVGADPQQQIARAYQLAYSRDPTADEVRLAERIVADLGLAVLARAIFNSNEFLYVD
jgi:hypothetical protein